MPAFSRVHCQLQSEQFCNWLVYLEGVVIGRSGFSLLPARSGAAEWTGQGVGFCVQGCAKMLARHKQLWKLFFFGDNILQYILINVTVSCVSCQHHCWAL